MSVFSKIRLSRKAAKERKSKAAEKDAPPKVPYKHVPTHAAVDALSGAPSSWKQEDRSKIKEHHKRRTMMGNMTRTASALSTVSYMNSAAGPSTQASPLPRTSSYSTYNPTWFDRGGDLYYSSGESSQARHKQPVRGHSYHDSGIGPSPLASSYHSAEVSPNISSGNSTSSNSSEHLEMSAPSKPKRLSKQRPQSERPQIERPETERSQVERPQPVVYQERDIFDRLHTSTTRKLGEAPSSDAPQNYQAPAKHSSRTPSVIAVEEKPKRQRWSLLGKKNAATIAV